MVLDLTNPKVQDYVYGVVDNLMTKYPGIAYFQVGLQQPDNEYLLSVSERSAVPFIH